MPQHQTPVAMSPRIEIGGLSISLPIQPPVLKETTQPIRLWGGTRRGDHGTGRAIPVRLQFTPVADGYELSTVSPSERVDEIDGSSTYSARRSRFSPVVWDVSAVQYSPYSPQ
ncbi:MAG: hypothetical protein ACREGI_02740 [Candidatus Levyibacteriota bacterium]